MSKIGRKPIQLPGNVKILNAGGLMTVTGPKGSLSLSVHPKLSIEIFDNSVTVNVASKEDELNVIHGTTRSRIQNMILGVMNGYRKQLELVGVGFTATMEGKALRMNIGFTHEIFFEPHPQIVLSVEKNTITIEGIDKQVVGETASKIRSFRPPDSYKGKGIRYADEVIRLKKGKTVGA